MIDIAQLATQRRTAKAFDPEKRISEALIEQLRTLLRFTPSSVNGQPWHFLFARTQKAKQQLAVAAQGSFAYNAPKILNASDVVVLCAKTNLDETHLAKVLEQEAADGRFSSPEGKAAQDKSRRFYAHHHQQTLSDEAEWINKQIYIALGSLLIGAATLEIDACAMEGIDFAALDSELNLTRLGLRSVVMVALGYRSDEDFNSKLPKSRLPAKQVITDL